MHVEYLTGDHQNAALKEQGRSYLWSYANSGNCSELELILENKLF